MPDVAYPEQFRKILQEVLALSQTHPTYNFELIQEFVETLRQASQPESQIQTWVEELSVLPEARQEAGLRIFEYALLKARQATYRPVNSLDRFIEYQLFGIQDEKIVENATISQILRAQQESVPPVRKPPRSTQPTNPLNPRNLPPIFPHPLKE